MNLLDIRTYTQNQTGNDGFYTPTEIDEAINYAQKIFCQETRYTDAIYTVNSIAQTQEYSMPSDLIEINEVTYDKLHLDNKELREILKITSSADSPSTPRHFYVRNNNIVGLYPIPSEAKEIAVYYRDIPATLTDDTDIPEIPVTFHRCLAYFAISEYKQKDNEYDQAIYWKKLFINEMESAKVFLVNNQPKYYNTVREPNLYY